MKRFLLAVYDGLPWRRLTRWVAYSERRRLLDRALNAHAHRVQGRVLELGAGRAGRRGQFTAARLPGDRWVMLDMDRDRQPHLVGDAVRLPLADEAFDTVLCLEVLEYVDEMPAALCELRRVLAVPAGTLILSMPFMSRTDHPLDRWRLTEPGLRALVTGAGFAIDAVIPQGAALLVAAHTLKFALYLVVRGRWWGWLLTALCWPPLMLLRALDAPATRAVRHLDGFSTGFLVIAHPAESPEGRA